jgi:hypothetical protein
MLRPAFSKTFGFRSGLSSSRMPRRVGPALRRGFALGLVLLVTGLSAGGCSRQGEGERCDLAANGDADCDEGLICLSKVGNVDRCCPPQGAPIGDSRCAVADAPPGGSTGGVSSSGGTNGSGGSAGMPAGGSSGGAAETPSGGTSGSGEPGGTDSAGSAGQAEAGMSGAAG